MKNDNEDCLYCGEPNCPQCWGRNTDAELNPVGRATPSDEPPLVTFAGKPLRWATPAWLEGHGIRIVRREGGYWRATRNGTGDSAVSQWDDPQHASNDLEASLREKLADLENFYAQQQTARMGSKEPPDAVSDNEAGPAPRCKMGWPPDNTEAPGSRLCGGV